MMASLINDAPLQIMRPEDVAQVTTADAYTSTKNALAGWLADQRADGVARGLINRDTGWPTEAGWIDALHQYAGALAAGTSAPGSRMKPGAIDIGNTTAHINPSAGDIARMMQAAPERRLRAFRDDDGNFAIWPAYDATHAEMATPLGFTEGAINMQLHGRVGPKDADFPHSAGRFSFYGTSDPKPGGK